MILVLKELTVSAGKSVTSLTKQLQRFLLVDVTKDGPLRGEADSIWCINKEGSVTSRIRNVTEKNHHVNNYRRNRWLSWKENTWRHLLLLAYGVVPGKLNPLVCLNARDTQKLHALHAVTCCLRVVVTAHAHL